MEDNLFGNFLKFFVIGIVGVSVFCGVMYLSLTAETGQTGIDVEDSVESVSDSATVIDYEQLSDQQQEEFRKSVVQSGYIFSDHEKLSEYNYIYLDGEYHPLEVGQYSEPVPMYQKFIALFAGFGVAFIGIIGGWSLAYSIAMGISMIAFKSGREEMLTRILEGIPSPKFSTVYAILAAVVVVLSVPLVGYAGFSATQIESPQNSQTVVEASSLSDEKETNFQRMAAGERLYLEEDSWMSGDVVVRSDGEYYDIDKTPLSMTLFIIPYGVSLYIMLMFILILGWAVSDSWLENLPEFKELSEDVHV